MRDWTVTCAHCYITETRGPLAPFTLTLVHPEANAGETKSFLNYFLGNRILIIYLILGDLEEIGINTGNWVDSTRDRNYWRALVNAALNLRVP